MNRCFVLCILVYLFMFSTMSCNFIVFIFVALLYIFVISLFRLSLFYTNKATDSASSFILICRYIFKNEEKVGLQELGPKFTLKLRWLQKGAFDTKFGEYEWIHKVSVLNMID